MRARRTLGHEGMGWGLRIGIAAAVLLILAATGLAIYGGTLKPVIGHYEQVVPNDRFAH